MRGFGHSSTKGPLTARSHASDLKLVLDKLEINQIYLVGWSDGGAVALSFIRILTL